MAGIKRLNEGRLFVLNTKNTTYCFEILPSGHPEHLYYGTRVQMDEASAAALHEQKAYAPGNSTVYSTEYPNLCLDDVRLEFSSYGKGDYREPMLQVRHADGSITSDFLFESAEVTDVFEPRQYLNEGEDLPFSCRTEGEAEECLKVTYCHREYALRLILFYRVFEECDVIARSCVLVNDSGESVTVERLMSLQLDLPGNDWRISTFNGAWAREMNRNDHFVTAGMHVNESVTGVSSNRANPFVMVSRSETGEQFGECIGCNLLYSGNHMESLSVGAFEKTRLLTGINPKFLQYRLEPGKALLTPEAILSFSDKGFDGMSGNMHFFVREHIVRGDWKKQDRPVLLNSWEASYFNFNEHKLMKLMRAGKKVGIELFVLDDGWFGKRDDDTSSLGDWRVNRKKLRHGLQGFADRIQKAGLQFGIWVEPEMVNRDSDCYRAHPEWAIAAPVGEHSEGRNQMLLDLSNTEVQEYIIAEMSEVFKQGVSYVKWDMNRNFSDYYSIGLEPHRQGELAHRYVLGLYRVMRELTQRFPHILFEGCASGGNRFDLGILCYFPQIWASDNTDAISRLGIQEGYSYGYPMSTVAAHVSSCPNHQTLRVTPLDSRYAVASYGILGYECNIGEMKRSERREIAEQIATYKKYRHTLQFGRFHRMQSGNVTKWLTVSEDGKEAVGMMLQKMVVPDTTYEDFRTIGLDETMRYHFRNVRKKHHIAQFGDLVNAVSPIHIKKDSLLHKLLGVFVKMDGEQEDMTVGGDVLNHRGVVLHPGFAATGYSGDVRLWQDYHSRVYYLEAEENNK